MNGLPLDCIVDGPKNWINDNRISNTVKLKMTKNFEDENSVLIEMLFSFS